MEDGREGVGGMVSGRPLEVELGAVRRDAGRSRPIRIFSLLWPVS
jgi:hypothetical protein